METEKYLQKILESNTIKSFSKKDPQIKEIKTIIKKWAGDQYKKIILIGSNEKNTLIKDFYDVDILISLKAKTKKNLSELKTSLEKIVSKNKYRIINNDTNLLIEVNDLHIKGSMDYHQIQIESIENPIVTNFNLHINHVLDSGKIDEIKLMKIWKIRHQLVFPSTYLELVVLKALKNSKKQNLTTNFNTVLNYLANNFLEDDYIDLANSKIKISKQLSESQKQIIKSKAIESLENFKEIEKIIW